MITFGDFVKNLRIKNELTLRMFCRISKLDPSNWSKIERGVHPPPKSKQILIEIANTLKLSEGSNEWYTLFELAAIKHFPIELIENQSVMEKLPVFFRTLRGEKPSRAELEKLIEMLKEA